VNTEAAAAAAAAFLDSVPEEGFGQEEDASVFVLLLSNEDKLAEDEGAGIVASYY
jgi:hypothetical protein